ncbi:MAG: hypothetical protein J6T35_01180, partial [Bacteroidales bacterium]|nr:hypothetical protein [Bacteroidales bacterium]
MKKKKIFLLAALTGLVFAGCNKTQVVNDATPLRETASTPTGPLSQLTVRVGTTQTKTGITVEEEAISNLQVLVFGTDGKLEAYGYNDDSEVSLMCTMGSKKIFAFVNTPSLETIHDTTALYNHPFSLTNIEEGTLPMKGRVQTTLSGNDNLTIRVERMVCKIILKSISTLSSESFPNARLEIDNIYLANAVNAINMKGNISQWANPITFTEGCSPLLYDLYRQTPLTIIGTQATNKVYYAMPNPTETDSFSEEWCPRHTRLVLYAHFYDGENLIRSGHYPIPLAGLKANNCYVIESYTVTRPGLEHPYEDGSKLTEGITIRIVDWEEND